MDMESPDAYTIRFNLGLPRFERTGLERPYSELSVPDERNLSYGVTSEDVQAAFLSYEGTLCSATPDTIRARATVAKDIAVYAWSQYDFYAVSMFWSISTIEAALAYRCDKGKQKSLSALLRQAFAEGFLNDQVRVLSDEVRGAYENYLFLHKFPKLYARDTGRTLAKMDQITEAWRLLSDAHRRRYGGSSADVLIYGLPRLRNDLAHGAHWIMPPRAAIQMYSQLVQIVNGLFDAL
jgi:hypothetical protein